MKDFQAYLEARGLSAKSQKEYLKSVGQALAFLDTEGSQISYPHLQLYINYLQADQKSPRYINDQLRALGHYLGYLERQGERSDNPARYLRLRGTTQRPAAVWTPFARLEAAFGAYQQAQPKNLKGQVLLSLLIFQAATAGDLAQLRKADIHLPSGEVHFVGHSRATPRTLTLDVRQAVLLAEFLNEKEEEAPLFGPVHRASQLSGRLIRQYLPKLGYELENAYHLRGSVIAHWLKQADIRQVQYWAGHRYISSTEYYRATDLEALQEDLMKYHPLRKKE